MMTTAYDTQNIFAKILRGEMPAQKIAEDDAALRELGPATVALAEAEGLPAHARSVAVRLRMNR